VIRAALPVRPEARRLLLGNLLNAIGVGMTLPFLFIYLTKVRHIDATVVGLVVGWMGLLSLLLAGPVGALIDRFGPRRVLLPLYVIDAVGIAGYGLVHAPWQAFVVASLSAMGGPAIFAGQNTMLTSVTNPDERQRVFGLSFAILNLGIGTGGIVAGFIADVHRPGSFQALYLVNAGTLAIPALILLSMPAVGGSHRAAADERRVAGGYREVLADRAFRRFTIFGLLLMSCGYAQIEVGFPAFSFIVGHVSTRVVAWGLAANTMTIVLAQLFVLKRLHGRSRSHALAAVGAIIALAWVILGLGGWGRSLSPVLAVLGVVLCATVFACGETLMSPVMPALTNALAPDELRGRYNAVGSMIWGVTGIIGPLTAAPLIGHDLAGVWLAVIIVGALGASAVALSLHRLLTPEQDGRVVSPAAADVIVTATQPIPLAADALG
jgi:MFS family permease